jgi:hypothetical protein
LNENKDECISCGRTLAEIRIEGLKQKAKGKIMTYDEELIKEAQVYWKKGEEVPLDLAVKLMEMGIILENNQGDL